jgi:hypothetical protein
MELDREKLNVYCHEIVYEYGYENENDCVITQAKPEQALRAPRLTDHVSTTAVCGETSPTFSAGGHRQEYPCYSLLRMRKLPTAHCLLPTARLTGLQLAGSNLRVWCLLQQVQDPDNRECNAARGFPCAVKLTVRSDRRHRLCYAVPVFRA